MGKMYRVIYDVHVSRLEDETNAMFNQGYRLYEMYKQDKLAYQNLDNLFVLVFFLPDRDDLRVEFPD